MIFPYTRPLFENYHPHPTGRRPTAISTFHISPLSPPQETICQFNVLHGKFEQIHKYRETYAYIGTRRCHYGRIHT